MRRGGSLVSQAQSLAGHGPAPPHQRIKDWGADVARGHALRLTFQHPARLPSPKFEAKLVGIFSRKGAEHAKVFLVFFACSASLREKMGT